MLKLPIGFKTYAMEAGIKYANRKDLSVILSENPCHYAGVFTSNKVIAAPVRLCRERKGKKVQAVVVNTGNANACTGEQGYQDAVAICSEAEKVFSLKDACALSLSTGVIGVPLPVEKALAGVRNYASGSTEPEDFGKAIMTTDTVPKFVSLKYKDCTITGFAKGAGMISPNMATLLVFILTDADIEQKKLQRLLLDNVEDTFNCITVDGDMSTNDSVILLANGKSGCKISSKEDLAGFSKALFEVMETLAKKVVDDGEGATKLIEIKVENAKSREDAIKAGRAIANSPLVKTAFFGNDPNWGRILCAAGYSGADIEESSAELFFVDRFIFKGQPVQYNKSELVEIMKKTREIRIILNLKRGKHSKRFFTCDFSYDYVKVNAEYTT